MWSVTGGGAGAAGSGAGFSGIDFAPVRFLCDDSLVYDLRSPIARDQRSVCWWAEASLSARMSTNLLHTDFFPTCGFHMGDSGPSRSG